ncbi:MAG: hypothetical protein JNG88_12515 [Phycisphaerales bacterium]|nr:hypothetical protein [Phycisphaerales bacterium]
MNRILEQLARINQQLAQLAVSQRIAIALGGLVVAGSMIWLVQWSATPEMTPLLREELSPQQITSIQQALEEMGETSKEVGGRVWVRAAANKAAILAQLQLSDKMPADSSASFEALIKESNPWISQEENDRRWTVAMKAELERVLRQLKGVRDASVLLNLNARRHTFSRETPQASAAITLVMSGGEPVPRNLAKAAARMVSGAVRGLPLKNVQVVDSNGTAAIDWESEEDGGAAGLHQLRREFEKQVTEKIRNHLAFDPKARINVQVELDLAAHSTDSNTPTDPVDISEQKSTEQSTRAPRSGQPGVQPNVGLSAGGGGGEDIRTIETSRSEKIPGRVIKKEEKPGGEIQSIFAAVNISHSYLASVYRRQNPQGAEPNAVQIDAVFQKEKTRIAAQVSVLLKPQSEEQVRVDWYYDVDSIGVTGGDGGQGGTLDTTLAALQGYGPTAGLSALALVALGLMFRMARHTDRGESFGLELGLPREAVEAARKASADVATVASRRSGSGGGRGGGGGASRSGGAIIGGEYVDTSEGVAPLPVGQAAATEGVLEAREVDERTVQVNKMIDQLGKFVSDDSDAVAAIFEQWMRRND